jgi:hypothetical protein
MANSENEVASYIRKMDVGETLSKNSGYQQFMRKAYSRACINVFFDIARGFNMGSEILDATLFRKINGKQGHLKKFRYANWQMSNSKGIYTNSLILSYSNIQGGGVAPSLHASLGARAATRPQLVVNHENRNQREIILQDEKNRVYLISAEGIILWGLDVKSRILSEIHQVDMLKNGNLQLLFNTRDKIYLLDRNGNDLAPFPLSLPSDATNGITVFDYDRTRDYRIYVATKNKKVLLYDTNGRLVDGWKFEGTQSEVTTPIQHFRISGRDHIVFKDKNNLYIVDRQGTPRIRHDVKLEHSSNPLVYEAFGRPKIICTDSRGLVHFFFFDGKHETVNAGSYSSRHFFTAGDLDGNGKFDFVFADGNQLTVTDRTGKRLFTERIQQGISYMPEIVNTGTKSRKVGVVAAGNNLIFLFNHDGSQYPGFPVTGSSPFTVGKPAENKSQFYLITTTSRGQMLTIPLN